LVIDVKKAPNVDDEIINFENLRHLTFYEGKKRQIKIFLGAEFFRWQFQGYIFKALLGESFVILYERRILACYFRGRFMLAILLLILDD